MTAVGPTPVLLSGPHTDNTLLTRVCDGRPSELTVAVAVPVSKASGASMNRPSEGGPLGAKTRATYCFRNARRLMHLDNLEAALLFLAMHKTPDTGLSSR
mmetsp:Transcript_17830/g.34321  ORF Transcript_17830/g.34321 Transcript_17830/m.34321 type:complete len:100 (+) Transcript_17830:395-694(+)